MYNLSSIMTKAHQIRKANSCTMSEALRNAWAIAKIDNRLFTLNMVDYQTAEQKAEVRKLNVERRSLDVKKKAQKVDREAAERKLFEDMGFVWSDEANAWMPVAA